MSRIFQTSPLLRHAARPSALQPGEARPGAARRLARLTAALCLALLSAAPVAAQIQTLDQGALIDGLRREGMGELLKHLAETAEFEDPADARFLLYSQHLYEFERKIDQATRTGDAQLREDAIQSFNDGLEVLRQLINEFPDHLQRPVWQTDLGELLLVDRLYDLNRYAAEFKEFGVTTPEQAQAFDDAVGEAVRTLWDADLRLFQITGDLPKRDDFTERYELTGIWRRLNNEYDQLKTPFYLSFAKFYTTLLDDEHDYFQSLKNDPVIPAPQQKSSPDAERQSLLADVLRRVEEMARRHQANDGVRYPMLSLWGRTLLAQGEPEAAIEKLDEVITASRADRYDLASRLAKAWALDRLDRRGEAQALFEQLEGHSLVEADLRYRLLVTDARHRMLLRDAEDATPQERPELLAQAYEPYLDLFNSSAILEDPNLGPEAAESLKFYVYRRWEANLDPDASLDAMPTVVTAAIAEMARINGQNLMVRARENNDPSLAEQARPSLERAVEAAESVRARENVQPRVRANAMLNEGVARYFLAQDDVQGQLAAASVFIELGEKLPDQELTQRALENAQAILRPLHNQSPRPEGVERKYTRFIDVLFEKHANSAVTHNERYYYALAVLEPAGRLYEAAQVLAEIPEGFADYWIAQEARLTLLQDVQRDPPEQVQADALASRLVEEAQTIERRALGQAPAAETPERERTLLRAAGVARLTRAEMALRDGAYARAIELLEGFEQRYEGLGDVLSQGLEKRILAMVNAGRFDEAAEQAQRMMQRFPDDAAYVIDQVLGRIESLIDRLRRQASQTLVSSEQQELRQRARNVADTAVKLAKLLVDWARGEGFSEEQLVAFELPYVKALRVAGELEAARERVDQMLSRFPNDPDVINNAMEVYFELGGGPESAEAVNREMLIQAARHANTLISGLQPNADGSYSAEYWNAWMRRLQINDRLGQQTDDIFFRVRQLEQNDPNLGGEPYKRELTRLKLKYAP